MTTTPQDSQGQCPFPKLAALRELDQDVLRNRADAYREASATGKVQWVPEFDAFFVFGREEVVEVTSRPDVFSSCIARGRGAMEVEDRVRQHVIDSPEMADLVAQGYGQNANVRAGLVADPPAHTRQRALIAPAFRPSRIRAIEGEINRVATGLLNRLVEMVDGGEVDLMPMWAEPFPLQVLAGVLGVPADRVDDYARWSEGLLLPVGKVEVTEEQFAEMVSARMQFDRFFSELILDRRQQPQDDFLTDFVTGADAEGQEPLSLDEMLGILEQSVIAGHETTTKLMASALVWLAEMPELLERFPDDPKFTDAFVDEILRLESPSQYGTRQAMEDTEIAGIPIPKGSAVTVSWGAANRDEREFPDPDALLAGRSNRAVHLGFGHGIHYCAGHALARAEMRIGLMEFAKRFGSVQLVNDGGRQGLTYAPSAMLHGPAVLPMRLERRPA